MNLPNLARSMALAPLLALPLASQAGTTDFDAEPIEMLSSASALTNMTMAAVGSLTSDEHADLILINDGLPALGFSYDIHNLVVQDVMESAVDVAFVSDGSPTGGPALAMASSRGIEVWTYDPSTQSFDVDGITLTGNPAGLQVTVGDLNGTGSVGDLLCRTNSSRKRIVKIYNPGGSATISSFDHSADLYTLEPIQWDSDGEMEIAVVSANGIEVLELNGTVAASFSNAMTSARIAVVKGGSTDRIAWVTKKSGSDVQYLNVADRVNTDTEITLGDLGITALAAGDLDGDGDDDLVLNQSEPELLLMLNDGGFSTATGDYFSVDTGGTNSVTTNLSCPVIYDFDRDGDNDIVYGVEDTGEIVRLRRNGSNADLVGGIDHTIYQPIPAGGEYQWYEGAGSAVVRLDITQPSSNVLNYPSKLISRVWRQADASSHMYTVPHRLDVFSVATTGTSEIEIWIEDSYDSDDIFNIELTYTNAPEEDFGVTVIVAFSANKIELASLGLDTPEDLTQIDVPEEGDEDNGAGTVCRPNVPCYEDDDDPPEEDAMGSTNGPQNP